MDIENFVSAYISNLNNFNQDNLKKYNIINHENNDNINSDINIKSKEITTSKELKKFAETRKKYYGNNTDLSNEEYFNIFENNLIETEKTNIDFFNLESNQKINYILDYIKRKKYKLRCDIYEKLEPIINNNEILKKYISIDKTFNIINKISFLKKSENGDYDIIFNNIKKTKKKFFN